jgi:hypothetical protein
LNNWKNSIEEAKHGLKGFLLRKSQKDFHFEINSDIRYKYLNQFKQILREITNCLIYRLVLLFQEIKWLSRMGIEIPNSAKELVSQVKINKYLNIVNNDALYLIIKIGKKIQTIQIEFRNISQHVSKGQKFDSSTFVSFT